MLFEHVILYQKLIGFKDLEFSFLFETYRKRTFSYVWCDIAVAALVQRQRSTFNKK